MGMGIDGYHCRACGLNFNGYWNSVSWIFWDGKCPECGSTDHDRLPRSVLEWGKGEAVLDWDDPGGEAVKPNWRPAKRDATP